ncbi:MAG: trehalose-6-phosphate synthase [Maricaulaceae bacterium]|jgi:trehalose 6-phosphate synthase
MPRVVAISNRTAVDPASRTGAASRAGGLSVAVGDALRASGGSWVGWSGATVEDAPRGATVIEDDGVEYVLTDLTEEEHDGYYISYANRNIWPIFHYRVDLASFDSEAFDIYAAVNQRFAKLVLPRLNDGDIVWVHDYHFLLMGDCLRRVGWRGPVGFFLHIPFPAPEIFRALPEHAQIARAMCAYDVIGFQADRDRLNFVRYLIEDHGAAELEDRRVRVFNNVVKIETYPIGIDAEQVAELAVSDAARDASERIGRFLGGRTFAIGVDRMDYSKGLPERFEAVGKLFDAYPETRGKLSVTQVAPPSRSKVEEYQELRMQLDQLAGRINGDYGDLDWIPLRYLARSFSREQLTGLFRIAQVGLVTPLRDGMNLVCKEFVMAQDGDDPGVLILSEFAGAAERLRGALVVNPHNTAAVAEAMHRALNMPLDQRIARWERLRSTIVEEDIAWWRERFLNDLAQAAPVS